MTEFAYLSSLQRKDLVDYVKSHYKAPRIVLAGAGGVDHDKLCSFADKYLGTLSSSYEDSPAGVPDLPPAVFTGSEVHHFYLETLLMNNPLVTVCCRRRKDL